jgi:hypothetical protein
MLFYANKPLRESGSLALPLPTGNFALGEWISDQKNGRQKKIAWQPCPRW